jgi:iron complex outermembrane receptor protein
VDRDSEFFRKVFFEVTYFNYLIKDEIVPFIINLKTYFKNAPRTRRAGLEIGFMSEPFEEIELTINYTFTDFYYESYLTDIYTPGGTIKEDYSNNRVPSVPEHIVNFILVKELELTEDISGLLVWDCDFISEMYVNDSNSEKSSAYFYGNFMAGLTYSNDHFDLTGFAGMNNIFDKRYASFININDYYGRYYETGEPRTFYFGLNFNYKI